VTSGRLADPAKPLEAFGAALGIDQSVWPAEESLAELTYDALVGADRAAALPLQTLRELATAYGDGLACRFLLDEQTVLTLSPTLAADDLARFHAAIEGIPLVRLALRLDKEILARTWVGVAPPYCRVLPYLYSQRLAHVLRRPPDQLGKELWGADKVRKVVFIVPDRAIHLNGDYLAIVGGGSAAAWSAAIPAVAPDADRVAHMRATCDELLTWHGLSLAGLTPLHLAVAGTSAPDDDIAAALWTHLTNLAVLYLANRTTEGNGVPPVATFNGSKKSIDMVLGDPADRGSDALQDGATHLIRLVEWVYDPHWSSSRSADRLSLVQTGVVQALQAVGRADRYARLLEIAPSLVADAQWLWQSFIEERIDDYLTQVRDLEDYVDKTVQGVTDQTSALVKSVSDTALSAVAALLGSFVAALVNPSLRRPIFTFGMILYAVYVVLFPLLYNMWTQRQTFKNALADFALRRARFEDRLTPDKVGQIVGERIVHNERRFNRTFRVTVAAYVVVVILALVAAFVLPGLLLHTATALRFF